MNVFQYQAQRQKKILIKPNILFWLVVCRECDFPIEMCVFTSSSIHLFIVVIRIYLLFFIVIHYYHRHHRRNLVVNSFFYPMGIFMISIRFLFYSNINRLCVVIDYLHVQLVMLLTSMV